MLICTDWDGCTYMCWAEKDTEDFEAGALMCATPVYEGGEVVALTLF